MKRLTFAICSLLFFTACEDEILYNFEEQFQIDLNIIDNYLEENNIEHIKDDSGIRYHALNIANGEVLERERQAAFFDVTIWYLDGTFMGSTNPGIDIANGGDGEFFTARRLDFYGPSNYGVLKYFNFIAPRMTLGDKYRVWVPSGLGYGFEVNPSLRGIQPNTNLIIEIEMTRIHDFAEG